MWLQLTTIVDAILVMVTRRRQHIIIRWKFSTELIRILHFANLIKKQNKNRHILALPAPMHNFNGIFRCIMGKQLIAKFRFSNWFVPYVKLLVSKPVVK